MAKHNLTNGMLITSNPKAKANHFRTQADKTTGGTRIMYLRKARNYYAEAGEMDKANECDDLMSRD